MMFVLERVSDPEIEPVLLAEMKRHLRVGADVTGDDGDISNLIVAARQWVEGYTGRALIDQTWKITVGENCFSGIVGSDRVRDAPLSWSRGWDYWVTRRQILLRKSPVLAITSFATVDTLGVSTAIDAGLYELAEPDSKWPRLVPLSGASWAGMLQVQYRAGFADRAGSPTEGAEKVPRCLVQAMKLWVQANYDTDKDMTPLLLKTAEQLVRQECSELRVA